MKILFKILLVVFLLLPLKAWGLDAIPGLKVFGGTTRAAYGNSTNPTIYVINTLTATTALSDSTRNGVDVKQGGLKSAIDDNVNNKIIIFEVSGYILYDGHYNIDQNYITIAGQTAPSPGITLRNSELSIDGSNVVIQHLRVRMDDCGTGDGSDCGDPFVSRDGINIYNEYVVVDHCSISWATDENIGMGTALLNNSTISNSIISEGLYNSNHPDGVHSKGLITEGGVNIGIVNNLFIHNFDRNPYFTSDGSRLTQALVANNVVYNVMELNTHNAPKTTADDFNIVGNVVIGGPSSGQYADSRAISLWWDTSNTTDMFVDNNRVEELGEAVRTQSGPSDWTNFVRLESGSDDEAECKVLSVAFAYPTGYTPMDSSNVETYVLANVGSRPDDRDSQDTGLISDVTAGTGSLIDAPSDVGWPTLTENTSTHTDLPSSPHADDDGDGYTNLEEWVHSFSAQVEDTGSITISNPQPDTALVCEADPRNVTISIATNVNATCKYDLDDEIYISMANTFSTTGGTSHSQVVNLGCDASYTIYTRCSDGVNTNGTSTAINFSIDAPPLGDTSPPVISSLLPVTPPEQVCESNPRDVVISVVTTDATPPVTCRACEDGASGCSDVTAYADMLANGGLEFSSNVYPNHSHTVSGNCGEEYTYQVRCIDDEGNANGSSTELTFSIIPETAYAAGGVSM